jgi:hypothetical protein
VHVDGIRLRYRDFGGGRYLVFGLVRIMDQNNQRIEGAEVSVEWTLPNGATESQLELTSPTGVARFRLRSRQTGVHELCVTDVVKAGYVYDPSQNHETCRTLTVP